MATTPNSLITPQTPNNTLATVLQTANTALDGTGTVVIAYTAGPNGSQCDGINLYPLGTNVQTVVRLFLNNGGATTTATNNAPITDYTLPATALSQQAAMGNVFVPVGFVIPPGWRITATIGTTVAAGWMPFGRGGDL